MAVLQHMLCNLIHLTKQEVVPTIVTFYIQSFMHIPTVILEEEKKKQM